MGAIKISPEQVRGVSKEFMQASQQSQEMVNKIQSSVQNLQSQWEGATQQRFYSEYEQWKVSMKQFVELLGGVSKELDVIAQRFEQADQGR